MFKSFNFIFERVRIAFRENIEYKANMWTAILANLTRLFVLMLFFFIFESLIGEILEWSNYDFMLYSGLILAGQKVAYFVSVRKFKYHLLIGDLNIILCKPISSLLFQFFRRLHGAVLIVFPILVSFVICLMVFGDYENYLLASFVFLFGMAFHSLYISIFESLAFFFKESGFLVNLYRDFNYSVNGFTPKMMENFSSVFYFIPGSLCGYFVVEILLGRVDYFWNIFWILGLMFIILCFILKFIWKFGLKKYEAFG